MAKKRTVVSMATINAAAAPNAEIAKIQRERYEDTKANIRQIGNKYFVNIGRNLLFADSRFQRITKAGSHKVSVLADKWNPAKCDPIRVSPHDEEGRFSIIDGFHRYLAAGIKGEDRIVCEVIMGLPQDPTERLKAEAYLFATQNDQVDTLTPTEKHNANLILEVPEYVSVENTCKKYNVVIRKTAGKSRAGVLSCYSTALRIARAYGEPLLDNTFLVICESRWNLNPLGFTDRTLKAISDVIRLHPEHREGVIGTMIQFLKPITPEQFIAHSMATYPERTRTEQFTLFLEDYVCTTLNIPRVYLANKNVERKRVAMDLSAS